MPDVGLTTATEPVPPDEKVTVKYSVQVGGLAVYSETYDVEKIAAEIAFEPGTGKRTVDAPLGGCRSISR